MKVGVVLPQAGRAAGRDTLLESTRRAQALGYDSVWVGDHIVVPWNSERPPALPDRPFLEALSCLAFLAGVTEGIGLGVGVLVLPYRPPVYTAKVLSTIDNLSQGRLHVGVGVGAWRDEFEALGAPFKERGSVGDEQLQIMLSLWEQERPRFEGKHYRFPELGFYPKPWQKPRPPVWVGGNSPQARRRAGRYGDAWHPLIRQIPPEQVAAGFQEVRQAAEAAGRDPDGVRLTAWAPVSLLSEPTRERKRSLMGDVAQLRGELKAYQEVGVEYVVLNFEAARYADRLQQWETFAREAVPYLKGTSL